ncbi:mitochondrial matrix iron-sulfur protein [Marasmius sp. AFHP31]|nr:mitochondrial matrix iron-sulfur protein [Marasmius sp. AFHP31]
MHFKDSKGNLIKTVEAKEGDDILGIAHEHDIDLEGACEGSVACSTCHVILELDVYDKLPDPEDDENDMLDVAFGLTDTSRPGCQVKLTKELDGMTATLPSATRNMDSPLMPDIGVHLCPGKRRADVSHPLKGANRALASEAPIPVNIPPY